MIACAYGLRSTLPYTMLGRFRSAPNCALPVTLSTPSGRTGLVPAALAACGGVSGAVTYAAVVHRAGPGIRLDLNDGRIFVVTVHDPEAPAALHGAERAEAVERRRESPVAARRPAMPKSCAWRT